MIEAFEQHERQLACVNLQYEHPLSVCLPHRKRIQFAPAHLTICRFVGDATIRTVTRRHVKSNLRKWPVVIAKIIFRYINTPRREPKKI